MRSNLETSKPPPLWATAGAVAGRFKWYRREGGGNRPSQPRAAILGNGSITPPQSTREPSFPFSLVLLDLGPMAPSFLPPPHPHHKWLRAPLHRFIGPIRSLRTSRWVRYVYELAGKHNIRDMDTIDQMAHVAAGMVGRRRLHRELTFKPPGGVTSGR